MKKTLILTIILVLTISLSACGNKETPTCDEGYILFEEKCYLDDTKKNQSVESPEEETPIEPEEKHKMFNLIEGQTEYFNVPYKRIDGVTQYMDIYFPENITEDMPVFIYVHGGGFLWGNKDLGNETHNINHVDYKNKFNDLGYIFISVEYQKVKNTNYPCLEGQISDVKDAIKWVKLNHEDLSSSDENIGLWGLSAGGALALAAALNPDENYESYYPEISSEVKYVIDFYGVTDIYAFYNVENYPNLSEKERNTEYWRVSTHTNLSSESPENFAEVKQYVDQHSPLHNYGKTDVKIAIHHGGSDKIVSFEQHAQTLFDKGIELGNEIYITKYDEKDHGFWWDTATFYESLLQKVVEDVLEFSK